MLKSQSNQVIREESKGRSMVEMLGVLAVIGVLSIGGITGYKYAMDYYQANTIANEVNIIRTDAKVKIGQGAESLALGAPYDSEDGESLSGGKGVLNFNSYPVEFDCLAGDSLVDDCREGDGYHITLGNIPKGVCKTLATLLNGMNDKRSVEVNNATFSGAADCNAEINLVAVYFDADPTLSGLNQGDEGNAGAHCETDDDCGGGYCVAGVCVDCLDDDDCGELICDQTVGKCRNCFSDADCGGGYCLNGQTCVDCLNNGHCGNEICDERSHTCRSCTEGECGSGRHCSGGVCALCRNAEDCGAGKACVDGSCSNTCSTDRDCRSNEHCQNAACTPNCESGDDCSPLGCTSNGVCESCTRGGNCNGSNKVCDEATGNCLECKTAEDCAENEACLNGSCGSQCLNDGNCRSNAYCENGTCTPNCQTSNDCDSLGCATNGHCQSCLEEGKCNGDNKVCDEASGRCVACATGADCADGKACIDGVCAEHCEEDNNCRADEHCEAEKCVKNCKTSNDCNKVGCNVKTGRCEPCTNTDSSCNGTLKACEQTKGECVACTSNSNCSGTTPYCNTSTHVCEKCKTDAQCGGGYKHCNTSTGACVTCTTTTPFFNTSTKACTACATATPYWNTSTMKCEVCPTATPKWNSSTKKCEACQAGYSWNATTGTCTNTCQTNADCKGRGINKPYCYMKQGYTYLQEYSTVASSEYYSGTCRNAETDGSNSFKIGSKTTFLSSKTMTHWSAQRFCSALGKSEVAPADVGTIVACSGGSLGGIYNICGTVSSTYQSSINNLGSGTLTWLTALNSIQIYILVKEGIYGQSAGAFMSLQHPHVSIKALCK